MKIEREKLYVRCHRRREVELLLFSLEKEKIKANCQEFSSTIDEIKRACFELFCVVAPHVRAK